MAVRVQREDFDPGAELDALVRGRGDVGGLASFIGLVRGQAGALDVLELEHYPGMTESELAAIEQEARQRWSLIDSLIIHRYGRLGLGERIVLVAACAAHRQDALDAVGFLIDWLKTRAPFWKRETGPGGSRWVEARDSDAAAARRWSPDG